MTPSTPSTMTRTITTRTICTSEHSSTPLVVFLVSLIMCHDPLWLKFIESFISCHPHVAHVVVFDSLRPLSTTTCPSPSSSFPLSSCSLTCRPTSTTRTPWKMTCATPPRGASTPTTTPTPSHHKWPKTW